jgi:hypothetical protein
MKHPAIVATKELVKSLEQREHEVLAWVGHDTIPADVSNVPLDVTPRLPHELVLVFGGWANNGPSNEIFAYDIEADHWSNVSIKLIHGCLNNSEFSNRLIKTCVAFDDIG